MALTYTKANELLRYITGQLGTTAYIGLSTTAPQRDGSGVTEPSSERGYARRQLTGMATPSGGQVTNDQTIYFPEATGEGWGTCLYFCLFNSATASAASSLTAYGQITDGQGHTGITITGGQVPLIRPEQLTLSLT